MCHQKCGAMSLFIELLSTIYFLNQIFVECADGFEVFFGQ